MRGHLSKAKAISNIPETGKLKGEEAKTNKTSSMVEEMVPSKAGALLSSFPCNIVHGHELCFQSAARTLILAKLSLVGETKKRGTKIGENT